MSNPLLPAQIDYSAFPDLYEIAYSTHVLLGNLISQGYTLPDDKGGCELKRLKLEAEAAMAKAKQIQTEAK